MRSDYKYDIFFSFAHMNANQVRPIYERMTELGLRVFWSEEKLEQGVSFPPQLESALMYSQHFAVYYSLEAKKSEWVQKECNFFLNSCHLKNRKNRRMYVLLACCEDDIPPFLSDLHRPKSSDDLVTEVVRTTLGSLEAELGQVANKLDTEKAKMQEARDYYRHNRFWKPIAENRNVHIFTCARDVADSATTMRGQGGRTNIDMWDYRGVLDITHFFASNYPNARVRIEDPTSKFQDLTNTSRMANHISQIRGKLEDKDCIIVGSPDVSDFAEIVLAEIHGIAPYTAARDKKSGFVVIKDRRYSSSSFYWAKEPHEEEGVAQIVKPGQYEYFPHKLAEEDGHPGKMHGILVVANNPFCKGGQHRKIVILSGFSGVATNAVAKILTDDHCLPEFFKLDEAYENIDQDFEALIGVEYVIDRNFASRDTRRIKDYANGITFERLVKI